ncbi:MAG: nitrous oxide-stimulated promoter family protein [Bacteroidales bacterium]|jgi:hypothetical protein|nr:nitrous oxide-stimulated promoter family protein [Bacteroidales bacterium]MDD3724512.1 nitrous oxide-stimulated promoter family protein [Bacteroidales bacterium]MDD4544960.1 nitrous oxide-stimulated promoter family protein [Bacteroidales bacterium]MDY0054524.1 nitrous oxide-stimulated promoter family protein [Bacteroidales bacterium]
MPKRIEKEKRILEFMVGLYCSKKEKNNKLCHNCHELIEYAKKRLDNCPFQEGKPSCKKCPKHCYKKEYREQIREVMRFSGPRMIIYYPKEALRHIFK